MRLYLKPRGDAAAVRNDHPSRTHCHLVVELHPYPQVEDLGLGCGLSIYPCRFYLPRGHYPGAAPCFSTGRGGQGFRRFPQFDSVAERKGKAFEPSLF